MGDVGAVAKAVDTIASWFMSEAGYGEFKKRRLVEAKKREIAGALARGDYGAVSRGIAELRRLSDEA
jgi:hypothetical protein